VRRSDGLAAAALLALLAGCAGISREVEKPGATVAQEQDWSYRIAAWPDFRRAACSLTFDDGTLDQYLLAFPELEARRIRATFFLIAGLREQGVWLDSGTPRLLFSWGAARRLAAAGHEIGSHGHTHADLTAAGADPELELAASLALLGAQIPSLDVPGTVSLSWSYWRHDESSRRLARAYYLAARGGGGLAGRQLNSSTPPDFYSVGALGLRPADDAGTWRNRAEQVLAEGGWLVAAFHGLDDGRIPARARGWEPLPLASFQGVLDYLQSRDYWLAPFGEVVRYIRERRQAVLRVKQKRPGRALLVLEDGLEDSIYDLRVTVALRLPPGWEQAAVYRQGRELEVWRDEAGRLCFRTPPDGSLLLVENLLRSGRSAH
jgi:peptidoglycan/xylan/chitin deacetylase (PgdA/CDA1 family)